MAKQKEPKRLCCCGCEKMLSARAERCHREGQVPPRIAAVQRNQSKVSRLERHLSQSINKTVMSTVASTSHQVNTSGLRQDEFIDIDMSDLEHHLGQSPPASPFTNLFIPDSMVPDGTVITASVKPATAAIQVNRSVGKAKAALWTEWRAQRENVTVSDEEEDDELPGILFPEDDEDSDHDEDSEPDYQAVDDDIEASVAEALSWYFSILVNKICKIIKIFG